MARWQPISGGEVPDDQPRQWLRGAAVGSAAEGDRLLLTGRTLTTQVSLRVCPARHGADCVQSTHSLPPAAAGVLTRRVCPRDGPKVDSPHRLTEKEAGRAVQGPRAVTAHE